MFSLISKHKPLSNMHKFIIQLSLVHPLLSNLCPILNDLLVSTYLAKSDLNKNFDIFLLTTSFENETFATKPICIISKFLIYKFYNKLIINK